MSKQPSVALGPQITASASARLRVLRGEPDEGSGVARLLSAEVVRDSLESLLAAHGPLRGNIYWAFLIGALAALRALPLIKVDVSVRAQGLVRPRTERIELKSAVSGYVAQVLARDNQTVKEGQLLLVLRSKEVEGRITRLKSQRHDHQIAQAI